MSIEAEKRTRRDLERALHDWLRALDEEVRSADIHVGSITYDRVNSLWVITVQRYGYLPEHKVTWLIDEARAWEQVRQTQLEVGETVNIAGLLKQTLRP